MRAQEANNVKVAAEQAAQAQQLQQLSASNAQLQQQVNALATQPAPVTMVGAPVMAAPAGIVPGQTVYAPGATPGSTVQYVAVQSIPPPGTPAQGVYAAPPPPK
jgi:hypothetical protein